MAAFPRRCPPRGASSRGAGHPHGVRGLRCPPRAPPARRGGAAGPALSSLLPAPSTRRAGGLSPLQGPPSLPLLPLLPLLQGGGPWRAGGWGDQGYLVLSKLGRIRVPWSRPIQGTPKTLTL